MKNNRKKSLGKRYGYGLMAFAYILSACGTANISQKRRSGSADVSPGPAGLAEEDGASLSLSLPKPPVRPVDILEIVVVSKTTPATSQIYRFPTNQSSFTMDRLVPGPYQLTLKLLNSRTGQVFAEGRGDAQLEKGRTSYAHITMTAVSPETGSLVISIDYGPIASPAVPPAGVCPLDARLPVCSKSGNDYKVQTFARNAQCEWEPKVVETVDNKFCKGLPGADLLPTFP